MGSMRLGRNGRKHVLISYPNSEVMNRSIASVVQCYCMRIVIKIYAQLKDIYTATHSVCIAFYQLIKFI